MVAPGTRVGPYEIVSLLGAGGMGEVYRAIDTRLDRDVAIKILPEAFATDPDRLARFEREAKVLASLNHPHIATIHGLEEGNGIRALVLELVDGETLAEVIGRGPIPLDEALPIARQIAEALEAAHEQGIIHRDLKPANIKITPDGRWLAYESDSSGRMEIYVRSYPQVGNLQRQVSTTDGTRPMWARNGRELFYLNGEGLLMSVAVRPGTTWNASPPAQILNRSYYLGGTNVGPVFDVAPEGQRFLVIKEDNSGNASDPPAIVVVQNWFEELKRLVPVN